MLYSILVVNNSIVCLVRSEMIMTNDEKLLKDLSDEIVKKLGGSVDFEELEVWPGYAIFWRGMKHDANNGEVFDVWIRTTIAYEQLIDDMDFKYHISDLLVYYHNEYEKDGWPSPYDHDHKKIFTVEGKNDNLRNQSSVKKVQ